MRPLKRTFKVWNPSFVRAQSWRQSWPWAAGGVALSAAVAINLPWWIAALFAISMGLAMVRLAHLSTVRDEGEIDDEAKRNSSNVQDELMRLRERELLEKRRHKLQSSVFLSRGDPEDLDQLIGWIDRRIEATGPDQAAECVSRFSTHLRNVFMASDTPQLPLDQAVDRINRWVKFLRSLDHFTLTHEMPGLDPDHQDFDRETPVLLLLSVVEQWGMSALRQSDADANFGLRWEILPNQTLLHGFGVEATLEPDNALVLTIEQANGQIKTEPGHWLCSLPSDGGRDR